MSGYIIRSKINPKLILCKNGQFICEDFVGPGHKDSAKIYKRKSIAEKLNNGQVKVEKYET